MSEPQMIEIRLIAGLIESGKLVTSDMDFLKMIENGISRPLNIPLSSIQIMQQLSKDVAVQQQQASQEHKPAEPKPTGQASQNQPKLVWIDKFEDTSHMMAEMVRLTDHMIEGDEILQKVIMPHNIMVNCLDEWATRELMEYMSYGGEQALDELRAAVYPMLASYSERTFTNEGRVYRVPYLTFSMQDKKDGTAMIDQEDRVYTFSIYMASDGKPRMLQGHIRDVFYEDNYSNSAEMTKALKDRKKATHSDLLECFENIKTGERCWCTVDLDAKEIAYFRGNEKWVKTWDITSFCDYVPGKLPGNINMPAFWEKKRPQERRLEIVNKGRQSIEKLHDKVLNKESLGVRRYLVNKKGDIIDGSIINGGTLEEFEQKTKKLRTFGCTVVEKYYRYGDIPYEDWNFREDKERADWAERN